MQSSQTPKLMPLAFAATGSRNAIPEASQLPGVINGASYADGFPPATRTAIVAGGKPPAGLDMNGILYEITQSLRWGHAGGQYAWNSAFATDTNVGGYPNGATLMRADLTGFWINTADNNATNPDATDGSAANWIPGYNYGVTAIAGLTNANVTLTPAQAAKNKITLAGNLTGNVQIIFPAWTKEWTIVNSATMGVFTITAKTASGAGVALASGYQKITGNGTDIVQPAESVAAATLTTQPVQFGQVSGVVGSARNLKMNVAAASASATLTADEIIVETALGGLRYCVANVNQTINLAGANGIGGMDTGSAPTSGYVAVYEMLNPTTGASGLIGVNATSVVAPNEYSNGHAPSGYTASALVSVWPTNGSGQLVPGILSGRMLSIVAANALSTSSMTGGTYTSLSISSIVPPNAISIAGQITAGNTTAGNSTSIGIAGTSNAIGGKSVGGNVAAAGGAISASFDTMYLYTQQTMYYATSAGGTGSGYSISINKYEI